MPASQLAKGLHATKMKLFHLFAGSSSTPSFARNSDLIINFPILQQVTREIQCCLLLHAFNHLVEVGGDIETDNYILGCGAGARLPLR